MKKNAKKQPRMLPDVLEAIKNLKEVRGSTEKKIINQICDVKNKPRNVTMQIKRAIRHALDSGAITHRAGKYRLAIDTKENVKATRTRRRRTRLTGRRRRGRSGTRIHKRRRQFRRARYSASVASRTTSRSVTSSSGISDSNTSESSITARSISTRRRSRAKRNIHVTKPKHRNRRGARISQPRPATPMPLDMETQNDEESPTDNRTIDSFQNSDNIAAQQETDNCWTENIETPQILEIMPPECDDTECLCNVKQEPSGEDEDEDTHGQLYM